MASDHPFLARSLWHLLHPMVYAVNEMDKTAVIDDR